MKKNTIGFTLTEIVVAITISVIIMGWVLTFLTKLQDDIVIAKQSTQVYTNLSDFIATMQNFSKLYSSGSIIVWTDSDYNAAILMKPDKSAGVLIGVVEEKNGGLSKLDPVANKSTYGKKIIAYQKLTAGQISSILTTPTNAYNVVFSDEWLFKNLMATTFLITPYNGGAIFEYNIKLETPFYEELNGQLRTNIDPKITTFPFTLDF